MPRGLTTKACKDKKKTEAPTQVPPTRKVSTPISPLLTQSLAMCRASFTQARPLNRGMRQRAAARTASEGGDSSSAGVS